MAKPLSTYRLQFRDGMTFGKAERLVPYLKRLGITHLYASPVFQATTGSTHGYDIVNPDQIDPVLGGREGFVSLAECLKREGLGLVLDIVPNHMAASLENPWWRDVIEWGHASRHAAVFDIDWEQPLTLPFLGESFSDALNAGSIQIRADRQNGTIALSCYDQLYPLNPATYASLFRNMSGEPAETLTLLSKQASAEAEEIFHGAMRALMAGVGGEALDAHLTRLSEDKAFVLQLHELQNYRLADWRQAQEGLSYRRFFEIAGLVGVRVEDPEVFEKVHHTTLSLVEDGLVDGLRVDHIDGLADPAAYLTRLRERIGPEIYLVIEKILGAEETLPADWPVDGTTGYEFITALNHLLAHPPGVGRLDDAYGKLNPESLTAKEEIQRSKTLMMQVNFAGEMEGLTRRATVLLARDGGDPVPAATVRAALEALLSAFPVYRTYGTANAMPERDRDLLESIAAKARKALDAAGRAALTRITALLSNPSEATASAELRLRFQQVSGPLMAKSIEDTLFYRHNAFLAFNEVGGEVWSAEGSHPSFHDIMARRQASEPFTMNATSTHDTKRGEDARARLLALSEDPERWIEGVSRWQTLLEGEPSIATDMQWLVFQALAGIWPSSSGGTIPEAECQALLERLQTFLEKAAREAKLVSNWSAVDDAYEASLKDFAARLLGPAGAEFRADFSETVKPFIRAGQMNSISQTVLKLTAPGLPDIYQGSEQCDFSLVDPDNRRPQDFARLEGDLDNLAQVSALDLDDTMLADGRLKQALVAKLLALRNSAPSLFQAGSYQPLAIEGENRNHLLAFLRRHEGRTLIVAVPLKTLCIGRGDPVDPGDGRTRIVLPDELLDRDFTDILTGRTIRFPERDDQVSRFAAAGYSVLADWRE